VAQAPGVPFEWRNVSEDGADWAMEMDITPVVRNSSGALQGGMLATLIDMVAGMALVFREDGYEHAATSEMHISYLAGARIGPVRAAAHVLRRDGRSAVVRVDVHDVGADELYVAAATVTFAVTLRVEDTV